MYDGPPPHLQDGVPYGTGPTVGYRRRSPARRPSPSRRDSPGRRDDRDREHSRRRNDRSRSPEPYVRNHALPYDDIESDAPRQRYRSEGTPTHDDYAHSRAQSSRDRGPYEQNSSLRDDQKKEPPSLRVVLRPLHQEISEEELYVGLDELAGGQNAMDGKIRGVEFYNLRRGGCEAIIQFRRMADAEDFVDQHYPSTNLLVSGHSRNERTAVVDVNFDRPRHEPPLHAPRHSARQEDDWECAQCGRFNYPDRELCFKCKADRAHYEVVAGPALTGETDEDPQQTPSQYLVVRDLEGSVSEEVLARGISKLFVDANLQKEASSSSVNKLKSTAPTTRMAGLGARPGTLRRVILMRDRKTNDSWRYGFAEFATIEDAMAAVAKFKALPKFTISSKPVAVGFIHTGVFVPSFEDSHRDGPELSFAPIYNPNVQLQYWDTRVYPSVLTVSTEPLVYDDGTQDDGDKTGTGGKPGSVKKVRRDKDPANKAIAMAPQMQMWSKKAAELHGAGKSRMHAEEDSVGKAHEDGSHPPEAGSDGPRNPHPADQYLSFADWDEMRCLACGWTTPSQKVLSQYNATHYKPEQLLVYHEVHGHKLYQDEKVRLQALEMLKQLGKEPRTIILRQPRFRSETPLTYTSYADPNELYCHLCSRQFLTLATLRLHETESQLHRTMLRDDANITRATAELATKTKAPTKMRPKVTLQPQYRDRARERRQVFKQPKKPSGKPSGKPHSSAAPSKEKKADADADDHKASRGAGMLAKMGWTSGSGLGAAGSGRTEAITTDAYAPGVGLGAEGGKLGDAAEEAARNTAGGFAAFVEKTKDRARERFERLG